MDFLNFNSVENVPGYDARAAFTVNSVSIFREEVDIVPTIVDENLSYIPWGGDNQMPFKIIKHIEKDETLATCEIFNAEVCYGSGLRYDTCIASAKVKNEVEDSLLYNDLAAYFLGVNQDFKHFGFAVSVLILNEDGTKIVRLLRKEACYCRFAPADAEGKIPSVLYANWRKCVLSRADIEVIGLLTPSSPFFSTSLKRPCDNLLVYIKNLSPSHFNAFMVLRSLEKNTYTSPDAGEWPFHDHTI